jgi:hypothetical protein
MGLLDENNETDDEVVCINGFDVITDISLQVFTLSFFRLRQIYCFFIFWEMAKRISAIMNMQISTCLK